MRPARQSDERSGPTLRIEAGLRRVLAANPSPMTQNGTNTYLIGEGRVAVIDPGPALATHFAAIQDALLPGETVSHIIVTHAHADHSSLARPLAELTKAPVFAFGGAAAGRSAMMQEFAASGAASGAGSGAGSGAAVGIGEGVDRRFRPDERLADGGEIDGQGWRLRAVHTPGHFGNHLCLAWGDRIFSGDHVMGWASSVVSPPDGDMGDYMASLDKLARLKARWLYPGHGDPVADPAARIAELQAHRKSREAQILAALAEGSADATALVEKVYRDTPPGLHGAARRNVLAHLLDLLQQCQVATCGPLRETAEFRLTR